MSVRMHVENLSPKTTGDAIRQLLLEEAQVAVEVRLVTDRHGKSRGRAFVEAPDGTEPGELIRAVDGLDLDGRSVRFSVAEPDAEPTRGVAPEFDDDEDDDDDRRGRSRPRTHPRKED